MCPDSYQSYSMFFAGVCGMGRCFSSYSAAKNGVARSHSCHGTCGLRFFGRGNCQLGAGLRFPVQAQLGILNVVPAYSDRSRDGRIRNMFPPASTLPCVVPSAGGAFSAGLSDVLSPLLSAVGFASDLSSSERAKEGTKRSEATRRAAAKVLEWVIHDLRRRKFARTNPIGATRQYRT